MKSITELFPRASKSFLASNAALTFAADKNDVQPIVATRRGKMNKTEAEYARILEAKKNRGEILSYEFEGMTLRWTCGDSILTYTPDFVVFTGATDRPEIRFIEVKGAFLKGNRERAVERFRHARTYWGKYFGFQLWQKTKDGWGTPKI